MDAETKGDCRVDPVLHGAEHIEALEERVQAGIDVARAQLSALNERTLDLMRAHPGATILVAVGAGYLIGRLASRR